MEINLYMGNITKQSSWRKQQYSTWGHTGTVAKMKLKLTKVYTHTCDTGRKSGQDQTKTNKSLLTLVTLETEDKTETDQGLYQHLWHWKSGQDKTKTTKVYTDTCDIGRKGGQDDTKNDQSLHWHLWHWKEEWPRWNRNWPKFTLTLVTLKERVAKMKQKLTKVYTDTWDIGRKSGQDETETDQGLHWHLWHWKEEWPRWNRKWPRFTLTLVTLVGRVATIKPKLTKVYTHTCDRAKKSSGRAGTKSDEATW